MEHTQLPAPSLTYAEDVRGERVNAVDAPQRHAVHSSMGVRHGARLPWFIAFTSLVALGFGIGCTSGNRNRGGSGTEDATVPELDAGRADRAPTDSAADDAGDGGEGGTDGRVRYVECAEDARFIYVVTDGSELLRFDGDTLEFEPIGDLRCPTQSLSAKP